MIGSFDRVVTIRTMWVVEQETEMYGSDKGKGLGVMREWEIDSRL